MMASAASRSAAGPTCWCNPPRNSRQQCKSHDGLLRTCKYCAAIARIRALEEKWPIQVNFPAYYVYIDHWAPSDFTYVQGGDGNPFVAVLASTAKLAEYKCFRDTVEMIWTLYLFRCKLPLFWQQSMRSFFGTRGLWCSFQPQKMRSMWMLKGRRVMLLNVLHWICRTSEIWSDYTRCR